MARSQIAITKTSAILSRVFWKEGYAPSDSGTFVTNLKKATIFSSARSASRAIKKHKLTGCQPTPVQL